MKEKVFLKFSFKEKFNKYTNTVNTDNVIRF